jgi:hypothetical protein
MRIFSALLLLGALAIPALAQDEAAVAAAKAACSRVPVEFSVKTDTTQHPTPKPDAGKALAYIIEDQREDTRPCIAGCSDVSEIAIDGTWMGANRGSSYFFFPVDPGTHHLCATWKKGRPRAQDRTSLLGFTAEAGATYYFRVKAIAVAPPTAYYSLDLEPVNVDEGQLLVAASPLSVFHEKK